MYRIGIDVGSTFTKYCVMDGGRIVDLFSEMTPVRQKGYFEEKLSILRKRYKEIEVASCGYGKGNIESIKCIHELTALAKGAYYVFPKTQLVLDIGGQDTKIITHSKGQLREFFFNDKCAAGSGMFLVNICKMLEKELTGIKIIDSEEPGIKLSTVCAVFAQSEIVELIADNVPEDEILKAVVWQVLVKAKAILGKVQSSDIVFSGGFSNIPGIELYARHLYGRKVLINDKGAYLSAIGCALTLAN